MRKFLVALFVTLLPVGVANAQSNGAMLIANAATTGTVINGLAKLSPAGTSVVRTGIADVGPDILGVVTNGAGTTGNALVITSGRVLCIFDGAGVTAGDWVINSTGTDGSCRTGGTTRPTASQPIGRAIATASGSSLGEIIIFPPGTTAVMSPSGNTTLTGSVIMAPINIAATGALDMTLAGGQCGHDINYTGTAAGTLTIGSGATPGCSVTVTPTSTNVLGLATIAVTGGSFKSSAACTTNPRTAALGSAISVRIISNAGSAPVVQVAGDCG